MPATINDAFNVFHTTLTPSSTETDAVKSHRQSIKLCLEANFEMTNFFRTGSTGNATGVSGYSDTDYFAVIPNAKLKNNSTTSLSDIRASLETRFPKTGVFVDSPAVVCPFGIYTAETTEIVPAYFLRVENGCNIYGIPDRNGGWMSASPLAHNSYVSTENDRLLKKMKPLIRFFKAWKYYNNVPISSFYLEMRIAKYASKENSIIYSIDIERILSYLVSNDIPAIIDPTGISGYIYPCFSDAKKTDTLSKLSTALSRAQKAIEAENNSKIEDAFYWWNMFFSNKFPSYSISK
jgi:hypothetical protein